MSLGPGVSHQVDDHLPMKACKKTVAKEEKMPKRKDGIARMRTLAADVAKSCEVMACFSVSS